jgi:hypothetical protein
LKFPHAGVPALCNRIQSSWLVVCVITFSCCSKPARLPPHLDCGYRADFVVEDVLLVEIKSIDRLLPIHQAQVLTYMRLLGLQQGLLMNFNNYRLVDGLKNLLL